MIKNIYVLCGGNSAEHEISLISAKAVINNLDREKYDVYPVFIDKKGAFHYLGLQKEMVEKPEDLIRTDEVSVQKSIIDFLQKNYKVDEENLFIPVLHGTYGEDGTIQGFLEILDVPYMGNNVLSSAICMDKAIANEILSYKNIAKSKFKVIYKSDFNHEKEKIKAEILNEFTLPVYVKPANCGSSVGITHVESEEDLMSGISEAFLYDDKILVEEEIIGDELQVSVIGNDEPKASLPGGLIMERPFLDYNAKYVDGKLIPLVPYEMSDEDYRRVQELAEKTYKVLGCKGLARVDIFLRRSDKKLFVNEINTFPGMTDLSMTPKLWKVTDGTTYPMLLEKLINLALENYKMKKGLLKTKK